MDEINRLTKRALKGDEKALYQLFSFLDQYNSPIAKFAGYSIVYQLAMNKLIPETAKDCEACGGKCCKSGLPVPVYDFDMEELKGRVRLEKKGDIYILPRPCPFLKGWACGIHEVKPYACLSFPFATEDEQIQVVNSYKGDSVPDFHVPEYCIAGKRVKDVLGKVVTEFEKKNGRVPTPKELYELLSKAAAKV